MEKILLNIVTKTKMCSVITIIVLIVVFLLIMIMLTGTVMAENNQIVVPKNLTESSNDANRVSQ
jgi:hypothetical protein